MTRRSLSRRMANWFAFLCAAYLGLAYLVLPEFWTVRDRHLGGLEMVTRTPQGIPGDPLNLGLVGAEAEVLNAFAMAKWDTADATTLKSAIEIGESVLFDRPYPDAPVSRLMFEGRPQDLAFEKPVGASADERHHVRLWQTRRTDTDGRPLWLGSASYDRGVGMSHDTGQITHHIGPDIDAERDFLLRDLSRAGVVETQETVPGIGATRSGRNGGGDPYFTDGDAVIGILRPL